MRDEERLRLLRSEETPLRGEGMRDEERLRLLRSEETPLRGEGMRDEERLRRKTVWSVGGRKPFEGIWNSGYAAPQASNAGALIPIHSSLYSGNAGALIPVHSSLYSEAKRRMFLVSEGMRAV
jgi:hypothetical protein